MALEKEKNTADKLANAAVGNDDDDDDDDKQLLSEKERLAIAMEIQRRNRRTRKPRGKNKLPTPIFLLSLPKSGTTSTHKFFTCGLGNTYASANHWVQPIGKKQMRAGQCMYDNVQKGRNILKGCGNYQVYTDIGAVWNDRMSSTRSSSNCYYPSIHGLDAIYNDYPNATIMIVHRNSTDWAKSIFTWNNLAGRLSRCPGFPVTPYSPEDQTHDHLQEWIEFYDQHTLSIRKFARDHPSMTFVEAALEPDKTASRLKTLTGIDADCWKKCKPEVGCVETDAHGNELPMSNALQKVRQRLARSNLNFAPYQQGGPLFEAPSTSIAVNEMLNVPLPIFVLSLPRTSLHRIHSYFRCGFKETNNDAANVRYRTVVVNDRENYSEEIEAGRKMWKNKQAGLSLMHGIDMESILTDISSFWEQDGKSICYFPSLHDLEGLFDSAPSASFLLLTRDSVDWAKEIHNNANLMGRLSMACGGDGFPQSPYEPEDRTQDDIQEWVDFYDEHTEAIRTFAAERPSLTYIEINMDINTGDQLEEQIGITASCW
ncbi:hypothetical protein MPSEU_000990100 [Mayamaea pseudoterrestris]|nr:hypothetical protein MPSEU_000990100 [Mayamaea pseudoterrestris]